MGNVVVESTRVLGSFIGPDRKLRALWRAALFYVLGTKVVLPLLDYGYEYLARVLHAGSELSPTNIMLGELELFLAALICTRFSPARST